MALEPRQDSASSKPPAPHRALSAWLYPLFGVTLVIAAAALAALLTVQHLRSRPVNLRPHTTQLANEIHRILHEQYVPEDAIEREPGVLLSDARSSWYLFRFRVHVPPDLNADGLRAVLRDSVLQGYAAAVQAYENSEGSAINLSLAGRVFAEVVFLPEEPPPPAQTDLRAASLHIADEVQRLVVAMGTPQEQYVPLGIADRENADARWSYMRAEATLPPGLTPQDVEARITQQMADRGVRMQLAEDETGTVLHVLVSDKECLEVFFPCPAAPGTPAPEELPDFNELPLESNGTAEAQAPDEQTAAQTPAPEPPGQLRVAIILDDGGYGGASTDAVWTLDSGLTLAILPNTPFGEATALQATALGFEVMLHMPMETYRGIATFPGQLETAMDAAQIRAITEAALEQVPGATGVNNHTGGKFTADAAAMRTFLQIIQEYGLYFIDSRTTGSSVALEEARALGIPCAARHVFLDNQLDREYIRRQFTQMIDVVKKRGEAVAIGHFRRDTVAVLQEMLPELEKESIQLVHASELVQ